MDTLAFYRKEIEKKNFQQIVFQMLLHDPVKFKAWDSNKVFEKILMTEE